MYKRQAHGFPVIVLAVIEHVVRDHDQMPTDRPQRQDLIGQKPGQILPPGVFRAVKFVGRQVGDAFQENASGTGFGVFLPSPRFFLQPPRQLPGQPLKPRVACLLYTSRCV